MVVLVLCLALGMAADLYVVVTTVFHSSTPGLIASGASPTAMFALWFAFPLAARNGTEAEA
jgi:hypothetical protein